MRVFFGGVLSLLMAGAAVAGEVEHKRGEYRFSIGAVPGFVEPAKMPDAWEAKAPGHTGATWRVWLYDEQVDRRTGRDRFYVDYAYEPKAASLLGSAGRYQIVFNPEYQDLVIHSVELRRAGRWQDRLEPERISLARREQDFEEDMANGNVTALIVLEDVRVDDVVRIRYSITGANPILEGQLLDLNSFGWQSPVLYSRLRVLHDPASQVDVRGGEGAPTPVIRSGNDATVVSAEASRIPAYADEGSYPVWYQPTPTAYVSRKRQWADVVAWALPLYPPSSALPADLESELAAWSKLPDPYARIRAALRAVQERVRYFGVEMGANTHRPTPPAETWNRRYGDCKDKVYLLKTLLERMGIQADPALVSTRRGRGIEEMPPAASVFDHVIVRAKVDGSTLWLDPTITSQGGDPRDSDASLYGVALPVAKGVSGLEAIAAPAERKSSISVNERYEPASNGREVALFIETTYKGKRADSARQSFSGTRDDEISRRYAEYYRKRFGELVVVRSPAIKDDLESNHLIVTEQYLLKSPFNNVGRTRALDVYAESLSEVSRLPDATVRSGPLYVGMPADYHHAIEVRLPERWSTSLRDETENLSSEAFAFQRQLSVSARRVQLSYDMKIKMRDLPTDKVAAHLGALRNVRDSLSSRLPLQVPEGEQRQERDARLKALLKDIGEEG